MKNQTTEIELKDRFPELYELVCKPENRVRDGIYAIPDGVEVLDVGWICWSPNATNPDRALETCRKAQAFIDKHGIDSIRVGCAYETSYWVLLSGEPEPFAGKRIGSGFNYGSTNVLTGCCDRMLILAEND